MEQSIIIPVSFDDLKQIVSEAVTSAVTGSLDRFIPDEKRYFTRKEVAEKFHVSLSAPLLLCGCLLSNCQINKIYDIILFNLY